MTASQIIIIVLGIALLAWTLYDLRRASSNRARAWVIIATGFAILGGLLVALG
ncbi:MAG: hypothetical protein ACO1ON_05345 [Nocardioides sp.]